MADTDTPDLAALAERQRTEAAKGLGHLAQVLIAIGIGLATVGEDEAAQCVARAGDELLAAMSALGVD